MSLLFTEGFDGNTITTLKYNASVNNLTIGAFGRNGTGAIKWNGVSSNGSVSWPIASGDQHVTMITGCAIFLHAVPSGDIPLWIANTGGVGAMTFTLHADGNCDMNGHATSSPPFGLSAWNYLEIKYTTNTSTGSYVVNVNGSTVLSQSGINTGNGNQTHLYLTLVASTNECMYIDDLYMLNGAGSSPWNDILGPMRIETLTPNANGTHSNWVNDASNSTNNFSHVNDKSDSTYVQTSTLNTVDTYACTDPAVTTGTPLAAVVWNRALALSTPQNITGVAYLSGTELDGSGNALTNSLAWYQEIFTTKPGGGSWSFTDLSNAEFGIKET